MQLLWFQWNSPFFVPNTHLHNHKQMSKDPQSASISQTRTLSLSVLFHFLSHHVWLHYFAFPQFHLKRSRAEALGPEAHANAWEVDGGWGGKKTLKCTHPCSPLCSDLSNKSTIMRNHYFCYAFMALLLHYTLMLSPPYSASPSPPLFHIKWVGEFKAFKMQNCQTATFLKLHCNCNEKMYRFILFTSVRHIKSFRACKATHLWGKRSAGKALILFKPQQTRPSSAALGYCHYVISGPGFHKPNRKVCQAVKWREQNSASGREKKHTLETFHCGTQCTQEFKVSPIKASKNVL